MLAPIGEVSENTTNVLSSVQEEIIKNKEKLIELKGDTEYNMIRNDSTTLISSKIGEKD